MASEVGNLSSSSDTTANSAGVSVIACQKRIPVRASFSLASGAISTGFRFIFFASFAMSASSLQTRIRVVAGCLPALPIDVQHPQAGWALNIPPGVLIIPEPAVLLIAFLQNGTIFIVARLIIGVDVDADIALVTLCINKTVPGCAQATSISLLRHASRPGLILPALTIGCPSGLFSARAIMREIHGLLLFVICNRRSMSGSGVILARVGIVLQFPHCLIWHRLVEGLEKKVTDMGQLVMKKPDMLRPAGSGCAALSNGMPAIYNKILGNSL
jgi:hypothetical protein